MYHGEDTIMVVNNDNENARYFSRNLMCPSSGISYPKPEPNSFSFNSPKGACQNCNGLGKVNEVSEEKIFPDKKLSIQNGGIAPIGEQKNSWIFKQLQIIAYRFNFKMTTPISKIPKKAIEVILNGGNDSFEVASKVMGVSQNYEIDFEGIHNFITNQFKESNSSSIKRWEKAFMDENICPTCNGSRLKKESLFFKIKNKNISDLAQLDIVQLADWFQKLKLSKSEAIIGTEILKEIKTRIQFLLDVGLNYLTLDRSSKTLSGGEAQRIRLATQIGSQLVGVLYILDEPSIGLHQRDNHKLINSLVKLRDIGNSIIVVEHDKGIMLEANHVIDIGPKAGKNGGEIISEGTPKEMLKSNTLTAAYLNGKKSFTIPNKRRKGNGKKITLKGASGNNLQDVNLTIPLGKMICVTGVS